MTEAERTPDTSAPPPSSSVLFEDLRTRLVRVEAQFNAAKVMREQRAMEIQSLDAQIMQLQGQWVLIKELLGELPTSPIPIHNNGAAS